MQRDEPLELVGELRAMRRLAARERIALDVVRVDQVIDAGNHRGGPHLAIRHHAADADAAEAHAVVAALAADQPRARGVAFHAVIRQRDLERGVDRLRARVGEEHVIEPRGRDAHHGVRELERRRVPIWKAARSP